jgi:hypothetical protein
MKRNCERIMKIDYGLQMLPTTILRIANAKEYQWLLQPELKAIKDGLEYVEQDNKTWSYKGYLNLQGQFQGVGKLTNSTWFDIGEWHENELHGSMMRDYYDDGYSFLA